MEFQKPAARKFRVLLIGEEPIDSSVTEAISNQLDVEFTFSDDEEETLRILEIDSEFDLIISDYNLDAKTGIDVATDLYQLSYGYIPYILALESADSDLEEEAHDVGVKQTLVKPITLDHMKNLIEEFNEAPSLAS